MLVDFAQFDAVLLDLDGTIYYEEHALPGAVELVARLQRDKRTFACITNGTTSPQRIVDRLAGMGITLGVEHIHSAAAAACEYVMERFAPRPRVFNLATGGVAQMLDGRVEWVESPDAVCDAVIAGAPANRFATYERQRVALALLRQHGAALVAICNDRLYPSPRGLEIGSGALTAMMSYASGVAPIFCGKPEPIFFQALCHRLGAQPARCLLIGDNLESDIAGGKAMGMRTILVLTGVTHREDIGENRPDLIINGVSELL